jgi:Icc-related predicted phosphoesterase
MKHWNKIPEDTDILITHGPAFGYRDVVTGRTDRLGCDDLRMRIEEIKPKFHVCGHIHTGYGYAWNENTYFFNASVLDESYKYAHKPITFDWNKDTNQIDFIDE